MAGQTIDYDALAKQNGGEIDYDAIAKQLGGQEIGPKNDAQRSLGEMAANAGSRFLQGINPLTSVKQLVDQPGETVKGIADSLLPFHPALAKKSLDEILKGNYAKGAMHGAYAFSPGILGSQGDQLANSVSEGDISGALGDAGAMAANAALIAKGPALLRGGARVVAKTPEGIARGIGSVAGGAGGYFLGRETGVPHLGWAGAYGGAHLGGKTAVDLLNYLKRMQGLEEPMPINAPIPPIRDSVSRPNVAIPALRSSSVASETQANVPVPPIRKSIILNLEEDKPKVPVPPVRKGTVQVDANETQQKIPIPPVRKSAIDKTASTYKDVSAQAEDLRAKADAFREKHEGNKVWNIFKGPWEKLEAQAVEAEKQAAALKKQLQ